MYIRIEDFYPSCHSKLENKDFHKLPQPDIYTFAIVGSPPHLHYELGFDQNMQGID